jgi:MoaA/NifB/PqqE/SkfB family radical SAM enzyme
MEVIKRFQLKMHMVTNGMLWTDEKIMALPPQTIVQFSIDSFRHDIYAAMRPRGDLVRVLGNLKRLAELRSDVIIGIQSLITKQTELYLEEIGSFCRQFGFDFNVIYPGTTKETYKEFYPERPHYLKNYTAPKGCAEPFTSVVVGIDGEIYPCCYMYGSLNKEKPGDKHIEEMVEGKINCVNAGEYRLGNIYVDDVYKIWNDKTMRSVRNAIYYSQNPTATYQELRNSTDLENGHGYCAMCALRWGKLC